MAFELKPPAPWASRGWKVKIRDRERVEPPHVTIMYKLNSWRLGLRTNQFLDKMPDPKEIPCKLIEAVRSSMSLLCLTWDRMYPENPVVSRTAKKPKTKPKRKPK